MSSGNHALYRFWKDEELLYIGITCNIPTRVREHKNSKPWWTDVNQITLEHYATRQDVEAAERQAIQNEEPVWNVTYNSGRGGGSAPRTIGVSPADIRIDELESETYMLTAEVAHANSTIEVRDQEVAYWKAKHLQICTNYAKAYSQYE